MLKTRITEMLGIEYPILQGGMMWISTPELAAAVSNAGGFGIITSADLASGEELRAQVRRTRELTDRPFGVNLSLFPHNASRNEEFVSIVIEERVRAVETSGGRGPDEYVPRLRQAGVRVIHKAVAARHATKAHQAGVDAIAVVGFESGGHQGNDEVATLVLTRAVVAAVDIPVIAGGGIADGNGLVAALALGAEGILMGTRFMATQECVLGPHIKQWLLDSGETDTLLIGRSIRGIRRVLSNRVSREIMQVDGRDTSPEELTARLSPLKHLDSIMTGDPNEALLPCGQSVGLIHSTPSVKEVIDSVVTEAVAAGHRLASTGLLHRPTTGS